MRTVPDEASLNETSAELTEGGNPHDVEELLPNSRRAMMQASRTPKEDLLVGGLDDWAHPGSALQSARLSGETDLGRLQEITLALIAEVLQEGLMVAGDLVGNEHIPWHGAPEQWAERIRREWLDEWADEVPPPGAIVWLDNTRSGDAVAHEVLAREGQK